MKIAVFGAGSIAKRHIRNLLQLGYTDIACMDPAAERRAEIAHLFPKITSYTSDTGLFAAERPAVAFICSPPQHHLPQLNLAIDHGCHCFVEKPFSLTPDGVADALRRAEGLNLRVMTAFNMRYVEPIKRMKQWVDEQLIGKILSCRIGLSSYMPNWHPWEDYRECFMAFTKSGGGALFDYVHGIDMVQWFNGQIESVSCMQKTTALEMETDDISVLIGQTERGIIFSLYFDFIDHLSRKSIELIGSQGTIIWTMESNHRLELYDAAKRLKTVSEQKLEWDRCYIEETEEFFECVAQGTRPSTDGWNGLSTQQVLAMAMESNRTGALVTRSVGDDT